VATRTTDMAEWATHVVPTAMHVADSTRLVVA